MRVLCCGVDAISGHLPLACSTPCASLHLPAPPQSLALLGSAEPLLLLLGEAPVTAGEPQLAAAAAAAATGGLAAEWQAAGLLVPAQILAALEGSGQPLRRGVGLSMPLVAPGATQGGDTGTGEPQLGALVDVCITLPDGRDAAVLLLDEGQYCAHPAGRLRGSAALELLALRALGLAVLPLPLHEWQALDGDESRQAKYLAARVAAAAAVSPAAS